MFYLFLLVVAALGVGVYLVFIFRLVPGAAEERLGILEPLPHDIGQWQGDESSPEGRAAQSRGRKREVRLFFAEGRGLFGQGRFLDGKRSLQNGDAGRMRQLTGE